MCLLRRSGIVTVNTHAQPGARVSIRLKPASGHLARAGGAAAVTEQVVAAMQEAADLCRTTDGLAQLLVGTHATESQASAQ
jgi:L-seryl-tRNA(Ser) seleniumtransferase